ncbi:MAG: type I glutamate--ammonia ligase [Nitrososphaerota archaeon]|nr:type I glutamate--ammonia ligase [Candidatus Geocrenenecus dongiae]
MVAEIKSSRELMEFLSRENIRFIDLQFTDILGRFHSLTVTRNIINENLFEKGVPKLDGSSIKGFTDISDSDLLLKPDLSTFALLPWWTGEYKAGRVICDIYLGYNRGRLTKDPRYVAQKTEEYLREHGFDACYIGPEVEFFVFEKVWWDVSIPSRGIGYYIDSSEAPWDSKSPSQDYKIRIKDGYLPSLPQDTLVEFRNNVSRILEDYFKIIVDAHHHEVATAGQCEIDLRHDTLKKIADNVQTYKYVVKNVAKNMGLIATFMPKPIYGDNGSGMHVHISLWRNGVNTFYDSDDQYAELSQTARYFIGGILEHGKALSAIVAPTTNSYKRLIAGYEAPVYLTWSKSNRSAVIRIPAYHKGRDTSTLKRIEFRAPDPSANPYLCFSAIIAAGLDGIKKKIDPGDPVDENIYKLAVEKKRELGIEKLPSDLREALQCLQSDREFLKPVMSDELINTWIELKLEECEQVNSIPHPYEFHLYFDI